MFQEGNTGPPRFGIQRLKCAVCNMRLPQYPCFLSQSSSASRTMSTSFRRSSKAYLRRRSDNDRDMLYIFLWSFFSGRGSCIYMILYLCIAGSLYFCNTGLRSGKQPAGAPFLHLVLSSIPESHSIPPFFPEIRQQRPHSLLRRNSFACS